MYEKYAKLKIRIPDPRPKVTQLPYAQRYLRRICENIVSHTVGRRAAADLEGFAHSAAAEGQWRR